MYQVNVYFMNILYMFWSFLYVFPPVWVCFTKNLATLLYIKYTFYDMYCWVFKITVTANQEPPMRTRNHLESSHSFKKGGVIQLTL
jgi:hypothetical protein